MKAAANGIPEGPILVTGRKFPEFPDKHKGYKGPVSWFCEATNGVKVCVTATSDARKKDVEEFLASGPEIESVK